MAKTGQFTAKCKGDEALGLKRQNTPREDFT